MERRDLKEYLGMVVDMESSCDLLSRLQQDLRRQLASIRDPQPKTFTLPNKPIKNLVKPEKPEQKAHLNIILLTIGYMLFGYFMAVCVIMAFPLVYAGAMIAFSFSTDLLLFLIDGRTSVIESTGDYTAALVKWILVPAFMWAVEPSVILGPVIGLCVMFRNLSKQRKQYNAKLEIYNAELKTYNAALLEYEREKRKYQEEMEEYRASVEKESSCVAIAVRKNENKRLFLRGELAKAEDKAAESAKCLQELYSRNIIHPKFRDFVSVCSLYEYIDTGICSELEGEYGAYKFLEQAKIAERIITRLDVIIGQLNAIQANQYELFTAIQANQQTLNRIWTSNRRILAKLDEDSEESGDVQSDEASAYFEERRQKEQSYRNRMDDFW